MTTNDRNTPIEAWEFSLSYVLIWPLGGYLLAAITSLITGLFPLAIFWCFGAGIGTFVHFISYLIIGIPLYSIFWKRAPILWTFPIGLPIGFAAGGLAMTGLSLFFGNDSYDLDWSRSVFIFGGLYGIVTAAAAIYSSRKNLR